MGADSYKNNPNQEIAVSAKGLSKAYRIWRDPGARLKAPFIDCLGKILPKAFRPKALNARLSHTGSSPYYNDFFALRTLDLEIEKGEAIGIIGRNGSGKSTLLQMLAGTLTPTTGEIRKHGRVAALLELGSGFNPEFTGRENIYLNGSLLGLSKQEIEQKLESILQFANIGEFIDQPVKTYSSGMTVRLAFAVQVQVEPDILIVDEALSVGDAFFQHRCFRKIEELMASGMTLLFVSHDSTTMRKVCQKCLLLDKGKALMYGETQEVLNEYTQILDKQIYAESANTDNKKKQSAKRQPTTHTIDAVQGIPNIDKRHGEGGSRVIGVSVFSEDGNPCNIFDTGTPFEVRITLLTDSFLETPLVGINIYDKLGNEIIATNNEYEDYALDSIESGGKLTVSFTLTPPPLAPGNYSIDVAVNDGTQASHILCDWISNAAVIEITSSELFHGRLRCPVKIRHQSSESRSLR